VNYYTFFYTPENKYGGFNILVMEVVAVVGVEVLEEKCRITHLLLRMCSIGLRLEFCVRAQIQKRIDD
jgi:hypothetical protein